MSSPVRFTVLKASGRLRLGATVECRVGAPIEPGAAGEAFALADVPGALRYFARALPVPLAEVERLVRDLSALGHPNVIGPIGAGEREGEALLVQEVPDGVPLTQWIAKQRTGGRIVPLTDVERILRQVVTALRHAHQAGVCHGGLTSSHVFLAARSSGDFQVQVADFGVVPLVAAHATSFPVHAWWHLAPEIAAKPAAVTPSADLFALGVLLVELLAGVALVPPSGTTPWREFASARTASIRSTIAQARPEASDALLDLAAALLHPLPRDRSPTTVIELSRQLPRISWEPRVRANAIDEILARDEPPTPPPGAIQRPETLAPSRNFVVSGASFNRPAASPPPPPPPSRAAIAAPPVPALPVPAPPVPALPVPAPTLAAPPPPPRPVLPPLPSPNALDEEATLSEIDVPAATRALVDDTIHAAPRPASPTPPPSSPSSWFASEATVITPPIPTVLTDDTPGERSMGDATLTDPTMTDVTGPVAPPPPAAPAGFFRAEGTAILAHPDQLASPRDDVSASEANTILPTQAPVAIAAPAPPVPAAPPPPVGASFMLAVETTQPELAMPSLAPAIGAPPPRMPPGAPDLAPSDAPPEAPTDAELLAHRALLGAVIVAGGAVLGLIIWGVMLAGRNS